MIGYQTGDPCFWCHLLSTKDCFCVYVFLQTAARRPNQVFCLDSRRDYHWLSPVLVLPCQEMLWLWVCWVPLSFLWCAMPFLQPLDTQFWQPQPQSAWPRCRQTLVRMTLTPVLKSLLTMPKPLFWVSKARGALRQVDAVRVGFIVV